MKFTIQHVDYVIKQSVSPKMFAREIVYYSGVYYYQSPLYSIFNRKYKSHQRSQRSLKNTQEVLIKIFMKILEVLIILG